MRVVINGAGIAGPTLAFWLDKSGHEVVLIEESPQLRSGGYVIDFWGLGYDIAERMGGTFFPIHASARPSVASLIEFFGGAPSYKVLEETQLRLRETLPLFLAVLGVLGVEWWWRRRAGLL